jgi:hypothetical protein
MSWEREWGRVRRGGRRYISGGRRGSYIRRGFESESDRFVVVVYVRVGWPFGGDVASRVGEILCVGKSDSGHRKRRGP